jgi:hypothetical protein
VLSLEAQGTASGREKLGMPRAREGRPVHDDVVNAVAGVLVRAGARQRLTVIEAMELSEQGSTPAQRDEAWRLSQHLLRVRGLV